MSAHYRHGVFTVGDMTIRFTPNPGAPPIVVGEIVAWRAFRVVKRGLMSTYAGYIWPPEGAANHASEVPTERHGTDDPGQGLHAFKTIEEARWQFPDALFAIAKVALWGEVVEHEKGYRAQFGKVLAIESVPYPDSVQRLRRMYHLPAKRGFRWRAYANPRFLAIAASIGIGVVIAYDMAHLLVVLVNRLLP